MPRRRQMQTPPPDLATQDLLGLMLAAAKALWAPITAVAAAIWSAVKWIIPRVVSDITEPRFEELEKRLEAKADATEMRTAMEKITTTLGAVSSDVSYIRGRIDKD